MLVRCVCVCAVCVNRIKCRTPNEKEMESLTWLMGWWLRYLMLHKIGTKHYRPTEFLTICLAFTTNKHLSRVTTRLRVIINLFVRMKRRRYIEQPTTTEIHSHTRHTMPHVSYKRVISFTSDGHVDHIFIRWHVNVRHAKVSVSAACNISMLVRFSFCVFYIQ